MTITSHTGATARPIHTGAHYDCLIIIESNNNIILRDDIYEMLPQNVVEDISSIPLYLRYNIYIYFIILIH